MDSLIAAASRALAHGDAIGALKHVALRDDPAALALRGIAMAQLGSLPRARELLRTAARRFGPGERLARARCVVAEAEVALALREPGRSAQALAAAAATLDACGDARNALHARLIGARRLLLLGRVDEAAAILVALVMKEPPPLLLAATELARAELALRRLHTRNARDALERARLAARRSGVRALEAEVDEALAVLDLPAARLKSPAGERLLVLQEVEVVLASDSLVVDACRRAVRFGGHSIPLARRPVLFSLAQALAEAWPADADRLVLIGRTFRTRRPDETHRARLRVEIGRLRALLAPLAAIKATGQGFVMQPHGGRSVALLLPPVEGHQGALLALLSDGSAWSTSALSQALGTSQRTVQRALADLQAQGRVRSTGQARSVRWLAPPLAGFATILLLPTALPPD